MLRRTCWLILSFCSKYRTLYIVGSSFLLLSGFTLSTVCQKGSPFVFSSPPFLLFEMYWALCLSSSCWDDDIARLSRRSLACISTGRGQAQGLLTAPLHTLSLHVLSNPHQRSQITYAAKSSADYLLLGLLTQLFKSFGGRQM